MVDLSPEKEGRRLDPITTEIVCADDLPEA
jgi:hypothetical protein